MKHETDKSLNIDLSIVIPAYLEEDNLKIILPKLNTVARTIVKNYEIIVVDTIVPMDKTDEVCRVNNVIYVNRKGGNTFGDAVRTGISMIRGRYTVFMDADGSHDPEFIANLYMQRNYSDIVIASRYIDGGRTDNGAILIMMSLIVNKLYSFALDLKCKDVSNSYKLYRSSDLKEIELKRSNFDVVEEILFKIKRNKQNLKIKEIPFTFKKRIYGKTKRNLILFIFTYAITIVRLRFDK